jgi:hypothetical protein
MGNIGGADGNGGQFRRLILRRKTKGLRKKDEGLMNCTSTPYIRTFYEK